MDYPALDRVTAAAYQVPTDQPEADGTLAWSSTTLVVAHVTGGGQTGVGYTYASAACVPLIEGPLAGAVTGHCVLDTGAAWQAMVRAVRNLGRPGLASCAISAVDAALWDLKAIMLGLPVSRLLGMTRPDVPVYGSGGFTTYDEPTARAQLERWTGERGIPRVKIKIGESGGTEPARDLARIAFARQVIGPQVAADVAAGEYGYDLVYFARMADAGAVDCLQADVTRCGGVTEWLRAAAVAAARGLQVSGHCAPSLHAHVGAAVPNLRHLEYFHDHVRIESMLFDGALDPRGGALYPDRARPGLGLVLKASDAERFRVA
jgi:L-alanine-DL-glutamate epimerase-like enolase superfamily enzyme